MLIYVFFKIVVLDQGVLLLCMCS